MSAEFKSDRNRGVDIENLDVEHELPPAEGDEVVPAGAAPPPPAAEGELEKLKQERDALFDRMARLQAEFENFRKRAAREQSDFREYAAADAVRQFLPVLDNLERALKSESRDQDLRSGVELITRQMHDALVRLSVQAIPAGKGELFDPRMHQAVEMVESPDVEPNHIVEELQRGYRLKDRLLRPAMVRVARGS